MSSAALSQSLVTSIAANSIIAVDNSFAVVIKPSNEVKGVVGEESSSVESFGN